jgi:hypothetical protein
MVVVVHIEIFPIVTLYSLVGRYQFSEQCAVPIFGLEVPLRSWRSSSLPYSQKHTIELYPDPGESSLNLCF